MSAAARPHKRAHCPCCSYENRASLVPAHIVAAHPEQIRLRTVKPDHCVLAYILKGKEEYGFCVCLTCKGGTMGDGYEGNHGRWVTLHARKKECVAAHPSAFAVFKSTIASSAAESAAPITSITLTPVTPSSSSVDTMASFWEQCRKSKKLLPFVEEFEKQITPEDDDPDDPFVFDPKNACERAIINACVFHKEFTKKKEELMTLECATKQEVINLQTQIKTLEGRTKYLETTLIEFTSKYYEQTKIVEEHTTRIKALETELGLYKAKYPDPINVD